MSLDSQPAVLLTLLLPGLAHFLMGHRVRAAVALGSCVLLYFVGWAIVQDRLFYYALISPDRDSTLAVVFRFFPIVQLPEAMNMGCSMVGSLLGFEGGFDAERWWRAPRDLEHIGAFLTATSGILAALWAADARWLVELRKRGVEETAAGGRIRPSVAAALSWLLPGSGHWLAGQKGKGLLMGAAIVILFAWGLIASDGNAVDRGIQPVWWIGEVLFGGGTLFASLFTAPLEFSRLPPLHDFGLTLCTVAGLMNLVVMIDAFSVAERAILPAPAAAAQEAAS